MASHGKDEPAHGLRSAVRPLDLQIPALDVFRAAVVTRDARHGRLHIEALLQSPKWLDEFAPPPRSPKASMSCSR